MGFKGLVQYHPGGKHGGAQADMVLEESKVLDLDQQAVGQEGEPLGLA